MQPKLKFCLFVAEIVSICILLDHVIKLLDTFLLVFIMNFIMRSFLCGLQIIVQCSKMNRIREKYKTYKHNIIM